MALAARANKPITVNGAEKEAPLGIEVDWKERCSNHNFVGQLKDLNRCDSKKYHAANTLQVMLNSPAE